jgi:uncharacterized beta-barrel protein YwiB (DUF1934 family)
MTKEVFVTIEGLQLGSEEESVTTSTCGTYYLREDKHYIQYEETLSEGDGITRNTIKIAPRRIDLTKKGANCSQMIFDLNETTEAVYQTPYGNLILEIKTTKIVFYEAPEKLQVELEYSLSTNGSHLSDNRIIIIITTQ